MKITRLIANRWPHMKSLEILTDPEYTHSLSENQLYEIIQYFEGIEKLVLIYLDIEPTTTYLHSSPPQRSLKELSVRWVTSSNPIMTSLPSLQNCSVREISVPQLESLALNKINLPRSGLKVLHIRNLLLRTKRNRQPNVNIKWRFLGFRHLLHSIPNLRSLQIGCLDLKNRTDLVQLIRIIFEECPKLKRLIMRNFYKPIFKPNDFKEIVPSLKHLAVGPWDLKCAKSFRQMLENSPNLRSLRISPNHDTGYTDEIQSLINLRLLKDPDFAVHEDYELC